MSNSDIESIQIDFGTTRVYPRFLQGDFTNNKYLEFYSVFAHVCKSITGYPLDEY